MTQRVTAILPVYFLNKIFLSSNRREAIDFFDGSLPKSMTGLLDLEKLELTKESFR